MNPKESSIRILIGLVWYWAPYASIVFGGFEIHRGLGFICLGLCLLSVSWGMAAMKRDERNPPGGGQRSPGQ